jgi:transketolase
LEELEKEGIRCRLISMHTVKPIDRECIIAAAKETGGVITLEEHNASGGLGGAVAEVLMDAGVQPKKFLRLAIPDRYVSLVGSHEWLLDQCGLSARKIEASVRKLLAA